MLEALLPPDAVSPGVPTATLLVTDGAAAGSTSTLSWMALDAPAASGPAAVQVTIAPLAPQLHPGPSADEKRSDDGSVSTTVMVPTLGALPTFRTVRV